MAYTTTLRIRRPRVSGGDPRFWAALVLALCAASAGWLVLSRDVDWPARNRAARAQAGTAETAGDYPLARSRYEAALADNPYDWDSRVRLANLLSRRLDARRDALRQYLLALAYSPDRSVAAEIEAEIGILRLLGDGGLEDPAYALEDMFLAVEAGVKEPFTNRLDIVLQEEGDRLWRLWRERGRGKIAYSRIEDERNGMYSASVELVFADGTALPVRLRCPLRNIWQLSMHLP